MPLHHIDGHRLEGITQDLGFEELFDDGVCVIEWPAYIMDQLMNERLEIEIKELENLNVCFYFIQLVMCMKRL